MDDWDDDRIPASTMRLYSKRVPAKDAAKQFVERVRRQIDEVDRKEKKAEDVQKSRYSHQDWNPASQSTSSKLEQKLKEPTELLFYQGATYECTYNVEGKFSQSQTALLYDIPSQDDLDNWRKIKVLVAPLGLKYIETDISTTSKQSYLDLGFTEVDIGIAPQRTHHLPNNVQAQRKQYGLKHRVTSTIHAAMGDTLPIMATEISRDNSNFKMWDKGQMIVIVSRTMFAIYTIFVGDKNGTLAALRELLTTKTQWMDYMEDVLELITINSDNNEEPVRNRVMGQQSFPFRICDVILPQCNTGFVYMLISMRDFNFMYIGMTNCLRTRIQKHNTGMGSASTTPAHLRPYALFAYICGFSGRRDLMYYIEREWKLKRDRMIRRGVHSAQSWANCGAEVINELNVETFGVNPTELTLVSLFRRT